MFVFVNAIPHQGIRCLHGDNPTIRVLEHGGKYCPPIAWPSYDGLMFVESIHVPLDPDTDAYLYATAPSFMSPIISMHSDPAS